MLENNESMRPHMFEHPKPQPPPKPDPLPPEPTPPETPPPDIVPAPSLPDPRPDSINDNLLAHQHIVNQVPESGCRHLSDF